jgi:hypothetical protein
MWEKGMVTKSDVMRYRPYMALEKRNRWAFVVIQIGIEHWSRFSSVRLRPWVDSLLAASGRWNVKDKSSNQSFLAWFSTLSIYIKFLGRSDLCCQCLAFSYPKNSDDLGWVPCKKDRTGVAWEGRAEVKKSWVATRRKEGKPRGG